MRGAVLTVYAAIFSAMVVLQVWGVATRRTMTAGELVRVLARNGMVRWLLVIAWLWWGWHVFVRVTL